MTSSLSDIFLQGGASPCLNSSERWSGSAKILHVNQLFLSIQHNLCPFEFHPIQSLTKAGDSTILLNSWFFQVQNVTVIKTSKSYVNLTWNGSMVHV